MGSGAWPFLVGGVICLVNSDNERDSNLLTSLSINRELLPRRASLLIGRCFAVWERLETLWLVLCSAELML